MRILIVADEVHLDVAIAAAMQGCACGASVTIIEPSQLQELLQESEYDVVIKNPDLNTVLQLIKKGYPLC